MGQLGKMLKRLLNKLLSVLKRVLKFIKKYWQYFALALAVVCIMFPAALPAVLAYFNAPAWALEAALYAKEAIQGWGILWQAAAAGTAAVLIAPEATKNVVGKVVDGAVEVGGKVIDGAAKVVGDGAKGIGTILSRAGVMKWLLIGGGVYLGVTLLNKQNSKPEVKYVEARPRPVQR